MGVFHVFLNCTNGTKPCKAPQIFSQKSLIIDVWQGSKYNSKTWILIVNSEHVLTGLKAQLTQTKMVNDVICDESIQTDQYAIIFLHKHRKILFISLSCLEIKKTNFLNFWCISSLDIDQTSK